VADVDEFKLRQATTDFFIPFAHRDPEELLGRGDVDIVVVATPPARHEQFVIAGLEGGKYVLCEKPLAHTLQSADRIMDLAQKHPGKLTVGHQRRFLPEVKKILWLRDHALLGKPLTARFVRRGPLATGAGGSIGWWGRWDTAGGGIVMTQFIHELDLLIHLLGRPVRVTAEIETRCAPIESEDTFSAEVEFDNGNRATCVGSIADGEVVNSFEVKGSLATAESPWALHLANGHADRAIAQLNRVFPPPPSPPSRHLFARGTRKLLRTLHLGGHVQSTKPPNLHLLYYSALLDAIDAGEELPVPAAEARAAVELCTAIYTAGMTGTAVSLPLGNDSLFYGGVTAEAYRKRVRPNKASRERRAESREIFGF